MRILAGKSQLLVAAAGVALAASYASAAMQLRMPAFSDPVGPRLVPYIIALGLVLSSVALVVEHYRTRAVATPDHNADDGLARISVVTLALLVGYYLVFDVLGFIVATMLFLLAFLSMTNRGRWLLNVAIAVAFPLVAYVVLIALLGARLPLGVLQGE